MNSLNLNSILLVDDDEISNLFNKIFIRKLNLNVNVDFVLNGREALDLLAPSEGGSAILLPCLLLLDIKMPIMDGWEFIKAFEEQFNPKFRDRFTVVMLTTSEDEGDKVRALNNPIVQEFIQKPLAEKAIKRLIRKYFLNT